MVSELRQAELMLIERLEPLALQCPDGDFDWDTWVIVDEFAVQTATRCPAKLAAPPDEFEPTIFTSFKALAKEAAAVLGDRGGDTRRALVDVVARAQRGDDSVAPWLADYLYGCDTPELVATVQRAATWLERTRAVLDVPDLDRYTIDDRYQWDHPAGGLRLRGKIDLVEEGSIRPVVVLASLDDARLDQVAYLALLHRLGRKGAPDSVVVASHATGSVTSLATDDLVDRAVGAAERAATSVLARTTGAGGLERRASFFTCQGCHWFDSCQARTDAEARTDVVRRGVRLAR